MENGVVGRLAANELRAHSQLMPGNDAASAPPPLRKSEAHPQVGGGELEGSTGSSSGRPSEPRPTLWVSDDHDSGVRGALQCAKEGSVRDRDLISVVGVVGVVLLLGLIRSINGLSIEFKDVDAPAWVQALGSVAAIFAAIALFRREQRAKEAEKREERRERIEARATLLECVAKLCLELHDVQMRALAIEDGRPSVPGDDLAKVRRDLSRYYRPRLVAYAEAVERWSMDAARSAREVQLIADCRILMLTTQDDLLRCIDDPRHRPTEAIDFSLKGTEMRNLNRLPA